MPLPIVRGINAIEQIRTYFVVDIPASIVKLLARDGEEGDNFGFSVSFSDDRALIGTLLDDENGNGAGAAYIFEEDANGTWIQKTKLLVGEPNQLGVR